MSISREKLPKHREIGTRSDFLDTECTRTRQCEEERCGRQMLDLADVNRAWNVLRIDMRLILSASMAQPWEFQLHFVFLASSWTFKARDGKGARATRNKTMWLCLIFCSKSELHQSHVLTKHQNSIRASFDKQGRYEFLRDCWTHKSQV